jgi:regulator of protease activity HflC (stomatin/prohibitin superfamily)
MGGFIATMLFLATIFVVTRTFIVVPQREAVIKERLGKFAGTLGPGFHFMVPFIDKAAYKQEMREQAIDVPPQMCITRDNIQVEVDGIVYLRVVDPEKAAYGIGNYRAASINLAQTTMRSEIGKLTLDETFSERDEMNESIVKEIDKASDPWGIKMIRYEIMNISPSRRVVDTMEQQMEAERRKRADIVLSQGEKEAKINVSEGERTRAINLSEGSKIRRINEAEGRATKIRLLAESSATAIEEVASAIQEPGGKAAVQMQLVEEFVDELGGILQKSEVAVVPQDLAKVKAFFEGVGQVSTTMSDD